MRNKKKGFTLIELLASIVILGIMAVFAIPMIVNMVDNSRDKVYISDAKKMIAKTDYKLRSASSDIEKPNPGECIVVSLVYLDSDDFDNPPNEGEYEREASYVIVKNVNSTMEYSVSIVEKTKNGDYRGIDLARESVLSSGSASSKVKTFKKSELVYVEDAKMSVEFINGKLGSSYVSEIDHVYNYPDLAESALQDNTSSPKITKASLSSTSGKNYNSLDATLTLKVDDADTPRNRLTVYTSLVSYDAAQASTGENYGDNNTFTKNYDFSGYSYNGEVLHIYVIVTDDKGNSAKKILNYQLHTNDAPEIDLNNSGVTRRDSDTYNSTTAKLRLAASDDINSANQLLVCFAEGENSSCADSEFVTYESYFGDKDSKDYTFTQCTGGCKLNGDTVALKAFVRDLNGGEVSKVFFYTFHDNTPPQFEKVEGDNYAKVESLTSNYNNLSVNITLNIKDDITAKELIRVHLTDGVNTKDVYYNPYGSIPYTFSGNYDGETRDLVITLIDELDSVSNPITIHYTVHEDVAPNISRLSVESDGNACPNVDLCPIERGGSNNVVVRLEAIDDITPDDTVKVCISENSGVCVASNSSAFTDSYGDTFRNYERRFSFSVPTDHPYDGNNRVRTLYVGLMDSSGHVTTDSVEYSLYKNQSPYVEMFEMVSGEENTAIDHGSLKTYIQMIVVDDFDENETVRMKITEDGVLKVDSTLDVYNRQGVVYILDGEYDGSIKKIGLELTDSYGDTTGQMYDYQLYTDVAPIIDSLTVSSVGTACENDMYQCLPTIGGSVNTMISMDVKDDITPLEQLAICITQNPSDCDIANTDNYVLLTQSAFEYTVVTTNSYPYLEDNPRKTIYVYAKDEKNHISSSSVEYLLYTDKAPLVSNNIVGWSSNPRVYSKESIAASNHIHFDLNASDDFDNDSVLKVRVCYTKGSSSTETCFTNNYVGYNQDGYDYDLPNTLDGSTYHIYARIRDSKHTTTTTETVTDPIDYTVHIEQNPEIQMFHVAKDSSGKYLVEFQVRDLLDTYKVCVGKTKCTNNYITKDINGETLSGTTGKIYVIEYPKPADLDAYDGEAISLTLNVVDSHNHSVTAKTDYTDYEICSYPDNDAESYEYSFDSTRTYEYPAGHIITNNQKISTQRCGGRCYYWVPDTTSSNPYLSSSCPTDGIFGYYTKTIYKRDSLMASQRCLQNETDRVKTTYQASCGYVDCFYNPNQNDYSYIAIGLTEYDCPEWGVIIGDEVHMATTYYKSYTISYNEEDHTVTLHPISRGAIHPASIEAGLYDYDSSATVPYIRVMDGY